MDQPTVVPPAPPRSWTPGFVPLVFGGITAAIGGLFLPWVSFVAPVLGRVDRTGLETGGGKATGLALVVLAAIAWQELQHPHDAARAVLLVGLVLMGVLLASDYHHLLQAIAEAKSEGFGQVNVGAGMFVSGGGLSAAATGAFARLRSPGADRPR